MLPLWDCSVVKKRLQEVKFLTIVKTGHSVLLIIGRIGILLNIMVLIMVPEKFSKENRFAFFNSGAIGWMVSEEPFMKFLKERRILDMLKIRASYGEIGDDNVKHVGCI